MCQPSDPLPGCGTGPTGRIRFVARELRSLMIAKTPNMISARRITETVINGAIVELSTLSMRRSCYG